MKFSKPVLFLLAMVSCSQLPMAEQRWNPHKNAATENSHQEVIRDLEKHEGRKPATVSQIVSASFKNLNRIKPGKFEIYVFPKINSQHSKELNDEEEYLAPPQVFEVSVVAINPCHQFFQGKLFNKLEPQKAFSAEMAIEKSRQCGILEFTDKKLKTMNKSLLRPDDQLMMRIFIDDTYTIHATDHVIFESRNNNRVVRRIADGESIGSGLSLFPIDLPLDDATNTDKQIISDHFNSKIDPVAIYQIKKRHAKDFTVTNCQGSIFRNKDPLGGKVEIGWCEGLPWPTLIDNGRFFSITQRLSVR
jgi:hypothetical protein